MQVHVGGEHFAYPKEDEQHLFRCEVFALVFDREGKAAETIAETVSSTLNAAQLA